MKLRIAVCCLTFAVTAAASGVARADDAPVRHLRGELTKVEASELTVRTAAGATHIVRIDAKTKIVGVVPTTPAEITSGTFIGTTNVPGESSTSVRALGVVVFPPSMAGTGEGDYAWDAPAGHGHASMSNGSVALRQATMMTNATVMGVNNGPSKVISVQYKGGAKTVTIPPGTPIVRIVAGSRRLLADGAHVVVFPSSHGGPAASIVVGEDGVVPPI